MPKSKLIEVWRLNVGLAEPRSAGVAALFFRCLTRFVTLYFQEIISEFFYLLSFKEPALRLNSFIGVLYCNILISALNIHFLCFPKGF